MAIEMIEVNIDCAPTFRRHAEYVFKTIFGILGIPFAFSCDAGAATTIYYGRNSSLARKAKIAIPADNLVDWLTCRPSAKWIDDLPVLYARDEPEQIYVKEGGRVILQFDPVMICFYCLARIEEIIDSRRDQWSCFPSRYSILHELKMLEDPIVNHYCRLFMSLIGDASPEVLQLPERNRWKDGKTFSVALTHDVDIPLRRHRGIMTRISRRFLNISTYPRDRYWNFDNWIHLEERHGFKSAFYFYAGICRHPYDPHYDIEDHALSRIIRRIHEQGWEVGLHGSYSSYVDSALLLKERMRLEKIVGGRIAGIRQHYLRFEIGKTWKEQSKAGFLYDTTLGYNEALGFRAGIAYPFQAFSLNNGQEIPIIELPLTIMDGALFSGSSGNIDKAITHCLAILEATRRLGGCATLLWHQRVWDNKDYTGWREVYERILRYLKQRDAWVTTPIEIVDWYIRRREELASNGG